LEILGVIPARGGSKAIPRKNLALLRNRPLIAYTCDAVRGSTLLTRTIISTDDPEIAQTVQQYGIEVPFMRPAELSEDSTVIIPVLQHALTALRPYRPDIVVLLQPTSPLRTSAHIDGALQLMIETNSDTVVSTIKVPHNFSPASVMRMENGLLTPYAEGTPILRRQDKPLVYARNGPAVLASKTEVIENGALMGNVMRGFEMDRLSSLDIDEAFDLELADMFMTLRDKQ
jgi:CMP-N,N'-diacetyllegionaminic acid synthase